MATDELLSRGEFLDRLRRTGRDADEVMAGCPDHALQSLLRQTPVTSALSRATGECRASEPDEDPRDGLTIEGHWTVFDSLTEINSWEGSFTERLLPGSTKKTLREGTPKMQFDHGHHPLLGSLPLGRWNEAREDETGSWSKGRMRNNWLILPFAEAIREGDVNGMSFRFSVVKEKWFDKNEDEIKDMREVFNLMFWGEDEDRLPLRRDLIEVKVSEAGPVVWPAYKATDVGARSQDGARMVIDLAALARAPRRDAGYVVAALDAELARAERGGTPPAGDPRERWQPAGRATLERMATETVTDVHNRSVDTATAVHTYEPPPTGPAAQHSTENTGEPQRTEAPAGKHSPSQRDAARPANPKDRKKDLRTRLRMATDVVLTLPPSS